MTMKAALVISMVVLLHGCVSHQKSSVSVYYKEPSSCELVGFMHKESSRSFEDALDKLREAAEEKGANLIRLDLAPNAETFIGGSTSKNWVITYYAEANT